MELKESTQPNTRRQRTTQEKVMTALLAAGALGMIAIIPDSDAVIPVAQAQPISHRRPMPAFTFPTLAGKTWSLANARGHVVLLNFWATWCPPCQAETPSLVKISDEYRKRGLYVVGVSMDNSNLGNVRAFVAHYHMPYPVLLPTAGSPVTAPVQAFPTSVLIDRDGKIAQSVEGELDDSSARKVINALLAEHVIEPLAKHSHNHIQAK